MHATSGEILLKTVIEDDWRIHVFPYQSARPECQVVHEVFEWGLWLQFATVIDRSRFQVLIYAGQSLAQTYDEILQATLDHVVSSIGPLPGARHGSEALPAPPYSPDPPSLPPHYIPEPLSSVPSYSTDLLSPAPAYSAEVPTPAPAYSAEVSISAPTCNVEVPTPTPIDLPDRPFNLPTVRRYSSLHWNV
ncbi:hypothetical protein C8T65DRAFT_699792 [Cerioporus squamosus]|nr:hypothetical protein C8T65DRAFT_699792 [Cerioporus squamosus]